MRDNGSLPHRVSYRHPGIDYTAPGSFFVTICCDKRRCLFGDVIGGIMQLNALGDIVRTEWLRSKTIRPEIEMDEFVVMPNHFHGIIHIVHDPLPDVTITCHDGARHNLHSGHGERDPMTGAHIGAPYRSTTCSAVGAHIGAPCRSTTCSTAGAHIGAPCQSTTCSTAKAHVGAPCRSTTCSAVGAHIGAPLRRTARSLGSIIAGFKSTVTMQINAVRGTPRQPVWQSRYHDHRIRTESSLHRIRAYIRNNPMQWYLDKHNPLRRP